MTRSASRLLLAAAPLLLATAVVAPASAAVRGAAEAGDTGGPGARSNMGLCSAYLAGLPAPTDPVTGERLGGNARSGVNLLIQALGPMLPDHLDSPGELYRVRAKEHPTDGAEAECLPRPAPGAAG